MFQGLQQSAGSFKANQHGQMCACNHCGIRFGKAEMAKAPDEKPASTSSATDSFSAKAPEKVKDEFTPYEIGLDKIEAAIKEAKDYAATLEKVLEELKKESADTFKPESKAS